MLKEGGKHRIAMGKELAQLSQLTLNFCHFLFSCTPPKSLGAPFLVPLLVQSLKVEYFNLGLGTSLSTLSLGTSLKPMTLDAMTLKNSGNIHLGRVPFQCTGGNGSRVGGLDGKNKLGNVEVENGSLEMLFQNVSCRYGG